MPTAWKKIKRFITLSLLRGRINRKINSKRNQLQLILFHLEKKELSKQEKILFSSKGLKLKKQIDNLIIRLNNLSTQQKNVG